MEMQIIINGDNGEMLEALRCLADGHRAKAIVEAFAPVHHPHDVGAPARETILTPMGHFWPIEKETAQPSPVMDPPPAPVPIDGRIKYKHCMTCGTQYVPVPKQIKPFCSKSCYMKDWFDRHKSKPVVNKQKEVNEIAPDAIKTALDAIVTAPDAIPPDAIVPEKSKPTKGKKFLPERHSTQKDNFGGMY